MMLYLSLFITGTHNDVSQEPVNDSPKQRVEVSDLVLAKVKASELEA